MKKTLIFSGSTLALAVAAACLRYWQRVAAFERETGLLTRHHPATLALVATLIAAGVALALLGRWSIRDWTGGSYLTAFSLPWGGMMVLYLVAGGLLVAAGLLGIREHQLGVMSQASRFAFSLALLPTGLDLALVGWLNVQKEEGRGRFAWPLLLPGYCGCFWLVSAYQQHTAEPNAMAYAPYFLGMVCAVGGCYLMASFSFEKPRPTWCLWLCGAGIVLLATSVVETADAHQVLACLGYLIYLFCQMTALLYRSQVPARLERWTPEQESMETEVTDHEQ